MTMNDSNPHDRALFEAMCREFNPADPTELPRRVEIARINNQLTDDEAERYAELVAKYGADNVWTTSELEKEFIIDGFLAPYCIVIRRADQVHGSVQFCHSPRFYFNFKAA